MEPYRYPWKRDENIETQDDCEMMCLKEETCIEYIYNTNTNECLIYDDAVTPNHELGQKTTYVLGQCNIEANPTVFPSLSPSSAPTQSCLDIVEENKCTFYYCIWDPNNEICVT